MTVTGARTTKLPDPLWVNGETWTKLMGELIKMDFKGTIRLVYGELAVTGTASSMVTVHGNPKHLAIFIAAASAAFTRAELESLGERAQLNGESVSGPFGSRVIGYTWTFPNVRVRHS